MGSERSVVAGSAAACASESWWNTFSTGKFIAKISYGPCVALRTSEARAQAFTPKHEAGVML